MKLLREKLGFKEAYERKVLVDKSGEPDPQIQQLEEILGALRYEHRPFEIPRDWVLAPAFLRPSLTIAATNCPGFAGSCLWREFKIQKVPH